VVNTFAKGSLTTATGTGVGSAADSWKDDADVSSVPGFWQYGVHVVNASGIATNDLSNTATIVTNADTAGTATWSRYNTLPYKIQATGTGVTDRLDGLKVEIQYFYGGTAAALAAAITAGDYKIEETTLAREGTSGDIYRTAYSFPQTSGSYQFSVWYTNTNGERTAVPGLQGATFVIP